jgi:hypothetical protein
MEVRSRKFQWIAWMTLLVALGISVAAYTIIYFNRPSAINIYNAIEIIDRSTESNKQKSKRIFRIIARGPDNIVADAIDLKIASGNIDPGGFAWARIVIRSHEKKIGNWREELERMRGDPGFEMFWSSIDRAFQE